MDDAKREAARKQLEDATRELMASDGWVRWAETRSKFHRYSFNNQLLIAFQRSDAMQVAGYRTWQSLGRQVRKGEHGIRIFAPIGGPCKSCNGGQREGLTCGRCGGSGRWQSFKLVSVFDVAQTDGDDLPAIPYEPVEGDSHGHHLATLEDFARSLGLSVDYQDTGSKDGWFNPATCSIVVSDSKPKNGQVVTLIHELAHALGIGYDGYGRHAAEVIVESVAYIVAREIGLDASSEALAYVASWGSDDDLAALKSYAGTIDELVTRFEEALGLKGAAVDLAA